MQTVQSTAQYLGFRLADEEYGTDILQVQEIKCWDSVTRVPHAPPYMLGVMNLRGSIVPLIDLRLRLGSGPARFEAATAVVVVQASGTRGRRTVGLVVDSVTQVYDVDPSQLLPPPGVTGRPCAAFIKAIADVDQRLLIILDIQDLVAASVQGGSGE